MLFKVILVVLSVAASVYIYQQYFPFCDSGPLSSTEFCKPCPMNGFCFNGKLTCDIGYAEYDEECILRDEAVEKAVREMTEAAKQALAEQHGRFQCDTSDRKGLTERELQHAMKQLDIISNDLFDVCWKQVEKNLEHYYKRVEYQSEEVILSTGCWIRNNAEKYEFHLAAAIVLIGLITCYRTKRNLRRYENQRECKETTSDSSEDEDDTEVSEKKASSSCESASTSVRAPSDFELKLKRLEGLGFNNRRQNIAMLLKHDLDMVNTIQDLLDNTNKT